MCFLHNLDTLSYLISLNHVHFYDDLLQIKINVLCVFNDKGCNRHFFESSRKHNNNVSNSHSLPEWALRDINQHLSVNLKYYKTIYYKHLCLKCLNHFSLEKIVS